MLLIIEYDCEMKKEKIRKLARWLRENNHPEFRKVASLIKTSSVDVRRANAEWKDVLRECWSCERHKDDIEYFSSSSVESWNGEAEEFVELKEKYAGKNPVDFCGKEHEEVVDGVGMFIGSELVEESVNLANGNARMIFNMIGVPMDDDTFLEVSAEDVPNVIRKINYLLNVPSASEDYIHPASEGRSGGQRVVEREDGVAEIEVRRGPLVIDSGTSRDYIDRTLERIRDIFISAAEKEDGVVVV